MKSSWAEERAEMTVWLSSYTQGINRWIESFLEDPSYEISKTKMLSQLDQWISRLQEYRNQIMMMKDTKSTRETKSHDGTSAETQVISETLSREGTQRDSQD